MSHTETAPLVLPLARNCPLLRERDLLAYRHHPGARTPHTQKLGPLAGLCISGDTRAIDRKGPQSLTGPDQSRCADWWLPPDSGTKVGDQAAGDPSRGAQHPEDTEQGPRVSVPQSHTMSLSPSSLAFFSSCPTSSFLPYCPPTCLGSQVIPLPCGLLRRSGCHQGESRGG